MPEPRELTRQALIEDYFDRLRRLGVAAEAHAILSESPDLREVFAHGASFGQGGTDHVARLLTSHTPAPNLNSEWLAKLARVCALQDSRSGDTQFALKALRLANRSLPKTSQNRRFHQLEVELLAEAGEYGEALERVHENSHLKNLFHDYLAVDLINPFIRKTGSFEQWLHGFNEPMRYCGLRPVSVDRSASIPFDGLRSHPVEGPAAVGPKVSVVMTSYRPDDEAFRLSARSILDQSWSNLELIIVDDATPGEFTSILDEVERSDSRVRVLRLEKNSGTYQARNAGMIAATGELITGQDADDWSHPDRLLTQVRYLQEHPDCPGVVTSAIRTDEDLVRIRRGQNPGRRCEVSLMVRSDVAKQVGGYLPARKAADSEFRQRLSYYTGHDVGELSDPLYIIRLLPNSLSRGDFRPGWSHPTRRAFWNACNYWHRNSTPEELRVELSNNSTDFPLPVPGRFHIVEPEKREYDVVFVADFREYQGHQRSVIAEAKLLADQNFRVGLLQLESMRYRATGVRPLVEPVQALINSGVVAHVVPGEGARVRTMVLRDPSLMQFPALENSGLRVNQLRIVGEDAPAALDGSSIQYRPADVHANAQRYFDTTALWIAGGQETRTALSHHGLPEELIMSDDWPLVFEASDWFVSRDRWRNVQAVVGRHSENQEVLWPRTAEEIDKVWPSGAGTDVRIYGDARPALRISGRRAYPDSWLVFKSDDISNRAFYSSIDFFIYYTDHFWPQDRSREVLEAMSAGCVVIVAKKPESIYKDGVIYADPDEVAGLVSLLRRDWARFSKQSEVGKRHASGVASRKESVRDLAELLCLSIDSNEMEDQDVATVVS